MNNGVGYQNFNVFSSFTINLNGLHCAFLYLLGLNVPKIEKVLGGVRVLFSGDKSKDPRSNFCNLTKA